MNHTLVQIKLCKLGFIYLTMHNQYFFRHASSRALGVLVLASPSTTLVQTEMSLKLFEGLK